MGSGYRGTVDALTPREAVGLRESVVTVLREREVLTLTTNVLYATTRR